MPPVQCIGFGCGQDHHSPNALRPPFIFVRFALAGTYSPPRSPIGFPGFLLLLIVKHSILRKGESLCASPIPLSFGHIFMRVCNRRILTKGAKCSRLRAVPLHPAPFGRYCPETLARLSRLPEVEDILSGECWSVFEVRMVKGTVARPLEREPMHLGGASASSLIRADRCARII